MIGITEWKLPGHSWRILGSCVLLVNLLIGTGCCTVGGMLNPHGGEKIYVGVMELVGGWERVLRGEKLYLIPILIVDFPLSAVADTLLLPFTIPHDLGAFGPVY